MTTWRAVAQGALLFGSWFLVQIPAKDLRASQPGTNFPPITQFKKVREFATAGECEAFRDIALQDSAMVGSEAALDQTSQLRCVAAEQLGAPTMPGTTPAAQ
jgi:hypothetical protein